MPHSVFGAIHLLHPMQNYRALKLGLLQAERGNSRPSTAETSFQSSVLIWRRLGHLQLTSMPFWPTNHLQVILNPAEYILSKSAKRIQRQIVT